MARYDERNGQLVPIDKDGKAKEGGKAFGVSGAPRKSFAELTREKQAAAQAGEQGAPVTGARTPPPAATSAFSIKCERCGLSFSSMDLAQQHACLDHTERQPEPLNGPTADDPRIKAIAEAAAARRTCALEGCEVSLEGRRANVRYCCDKHKRKAAYMRRKS